IIDFWSLQKADDRELTALPMPIPLHAGRKPASIRVHISNNAGVDITWSDGHVSHYEFVYLRDNCPCATCNDERDKKAPLAETSTASPSSSALPMFNPKPLGQSPPQVGNYPVQIGFTDGPSTGIYSYDYPRSTCPCAECKKASGAKA